MIHYPVLGNDATFVLYIHLMLIECGEFIDDNLSKLNADIGLLLIGSHLNLRRTVSSQKK